VSYCALLKKGGNTFSSGGFHLKKPCFCLVNYERQSNLLEGLHPAQRAEVLVIRSRELKSAPVGVVGKVLRILEALHDAPSGLQLKDVAKQTSINKSTAYRFLAHLDGAGYLYRDSVGNYVIGPKLARLGTGMNYDVMLRKISRPVLQHIWESTGETANLGILDGHHVLYIDVIESSHTFRLASEVGARRPLHCTSLGKAMAAYLPEQELQDLLKSIKLERQTPKTIVQRLKFEKELARIRQRGFAVDDEEAVLGARCVASPIIDSTGKAIAAISVSGPVTRIASNRISPLGVLLKQAAASISSRLPRAQAKET
jgi:DNA-binding IclR family transcriptional regulator